MSSDDADEFVRQTQLTLMAAAQQHGWFGAGFNWTKRERELVLENREALTPDRIEAAVEKWWEIKEPIERFDPRRSLAYIVTVCKNQKESASEPQWQRNGYGRNGRVLSGGYENTVAEPKLDGIDDFPHIVY